MSYSIKSIPRQKLSRTKKTKKWAETTIDELEKISHTDTYNGRSSRYRKQVNYDLYNGRLDKEDFEYVINPYGFKEDEFPATLQHYDIVSPKINLLLGEEIKRPFNFRPISVNTDAITAHEEEKKTHILETYRNYIGAIIGEDEETEKSYQNIIDNMDKEMKYSFSDMREKFASHALKYLHREQDLEYKFNEGFKDALVAGEEIYWTGIVNGEPVLRLVNPVDVTVLMNPDDHFIDDAYAIIEERWLLPSSILDEFNQSLTDKQIDDLMSDYDASQNFGTDSVAYPTVDIVIKGDNDTSGSSHRKRFYDDDGAIRVVRCEWKSMRKLGFLHMTDEHGDETIEFVDELFEVPKGSPKDKDGYYHFEDMKLKWYWVSEYWEGTKIGEDLYIDMQPKQNQRRNIDNPSICKSGYTGLIYSARNTESVSLLDRMKNYQYLYNIIYYRLELALAKSKGKVALMDIAQIPSSEGWDVDKWMYYLDAMGVMFINSHEEGPRGERALFNQFNSVDLTMGNFINTHIGLLEMIESKVGELCGVTKQRQGQIQASELVGNVERSTAQSSHITEYLFFSHNEVKRKALEGLIDVARIAWKKGKKIQYVSDDMSRQFIQIDGTDFANTQYGVFVSNSSKDEQNINTMKQLLDGAVRADQIAMHEVATVLMSDSIVEMRKELEVGAERKQQRDAQAQEGALKQQEAQMKAMQAIEDQKNQLEQDKLRVDVENNIRDNETKLMIASKDNLDNDSSMDEAKLDLDREKQKDVRKMHEDKLNLARKQMEEGLGLKKQEIAIKKKQANKPSK